MYKLGLVTALVMENLLDVAVLIEVELVDDVNEVEEASLVAALAS